MSAQLRGDTALLMGAKTLEKVWYLKINDVETGLNTRNLHHPDTDS